MQGLLTTEYFQVKRRGGGGEGGEGEQDQEQEQDEFTQDVRTSLAL